MSPVDRHVHIGLRADVGPWTRSMWQVIRDAERLALQVQEPVAMNADGTVRPARRSDHVWGHAYDVSPHIGELLAAGPRPLSRVARRAERRRVTRQLRVDQRAWSRSQRQCRRRAADRQYLAHHPGATPLPAPYRVLVARPVPHQPRTSGVRP